MSPATPKPLGSSRDVAADARIGGRSAARWVLSGCGPSLAAVSAALFAQRLALPLAVIAFGAAGRVPAALALLAAALFGFVRSAAGDRVVRAVRRNVVDAFLLPFEHGAPTALPLGETVTPTLSIAIPTLLDWSVDGVAAIVAGLLALPLVTAVLASALGPRVFVALAVAALAGAAITVAVSRRLGSAWSTAWSRTRVVLRQVGSCYDGAVELHAHDRASEMARSVRRALEAWSAADTRARLLQATSSWGALGATVFAGMAAAALLVPTGSGGDAGAAADPYRAGLLVLAAIPTVQMLVSGVVHVVRGRESLRAIADQLDLAPGGPLTQGAAAAAEAKETATDASLASTDPRAELRFEDVTFSYSRASEPAVRGLSFTIPRDASMTIVGRNGAGKTTAMYLLLGLLEPERGRISFGGAGLPTDRAGWRRRVAYLSQRPFELRDGTIAENLRALDPDLADVELHRALERVGLWRTLRARAASDAAALGLGYGELSRGESRRVLLARTLLRKADLLVLDEPETNLDPESVAELATLLREEAKERRVIAVVHDPALVGWAAANLTLGCSDAS